MTTGEPKTAADREAWAVVTSRKYPLLAVIQPAVSEVNGLTLTMTAPGMPPLTIEHDRAGATCKVELWTVCGEGRDLGDEAAAWIRDAIKAKGKHLRLVHFEGGDDVTVVGGNKTTNKTTNKISNKITNTNTNMAPRLPCLEEHWNGGAEVDSVYLEGTQLGYADSTDCVLLSTASLQDLNTRLPTGTADMEVERFRPNIVVQGCAMPYEEDLWKQVEVGGHHFTMSRLCNRCSVTMVNPTTGKAQVGAPLKTLRQYRLFSHLWHLDARHGNSPLFGIKLCIDGPKTGALSTGDTISVPEYREAYDRQY